MVYAEFNIEKDKNNYFENKVKKNLNSWIKIEEKRTNDLNNFIKECYNNNSDIKQNINNNQHYLINK